MNAFGYAREREKFIENAREKCRYLRNEFENQFKTSCDMSLAGIWTTCSLSMHHGSDHHFILYEKFQNILCDFIGTRGGYIGI